MGEFVGRLVEGGRERKSGRGREEEGGWEGGMEGELEWGRGGGGGGDRDSERETKRKSMGRAGLYLSSISCSVSNLFEACERAEEGVSGGDKRKRRRLLAAVGLEAGVADVLQARQRREEHLLLPGVHAHRRHTRRAVHLRPPP